MKIWTKTDVFGLVFVLFAVVSLIFSDSNTLVIISLLLASTSLLYSLYEAKFDSAKYRDLLCHYQAILSANSDGWIAWNQAHEYINSSKKFRDLFCFKGTSDISFSNILAMLNNQDADNLSIAFNTLKKTGQFFEVIVSTSDNKKLKFSGTKMLIGGLETITLWCRNITETFSAVHHMETDLQQAKMKIDSLCEILNSIPFQIWKHNEDLEIVYCNKAYADSLNTTADKVIFDNIPLVPGSIFGQGHSLAENVKKSGRSQHISQSVIIDGVRKRISMNEVPTANKEVVGYAVDITREENLASDLDRVITANCEVLENLSTAIAIFDGDTRLSFFNGAYQRLMKLESSWLHSKPTYGEVLDERRINRQLPEHADFQGFKKSQLQLFTSITSPVQELLHLPNGKTLRMLIAPYPLGGLLFVYEDVTDSLMLQRKNNTLLAVQRETLNNLYEGIMVYGSDNRLKIVNKALLSMWKLDDCSLEELKGIHLSEMLDKLKDKLNYGSDWERFRENAVSNLTDRITKMGKLEKNDNSVILFNYIPLPDGAHMHSFVDITDTYNVEKAVMERDQIMKTAQNMRFEFVSSISTELKEPLNSLIGFSELLINQYFGQLNAKQMEYCKYILSSSNQLHALVDNLLEMVSIDIDSGKLRVLPFSVAEAMEEVVSGIDKRAKEKNIDIIRHYDKNDLIFNGDKTRIKQAIFNVLVNAVQFTPPNGKVELRVVSDDDHIKIIIKDECAIDDSHSTFRRSGRKIMNFINADCNSISMPLVRALIEMHGGTLQISSDNIEHSMSVICTLPLKLREEHGHASDSSEVSTSDGPEDSSEFSKKIVNL